MKALSSILILACTTILIESCSNVSHTSATSPAAAGFHNGNYTLDEYEMKLTPDQLRQRIQSEAILAANQRKEEMRKERASRPLDVGLGIAIGGNPMKLGSKKSDLPSQRTIAKMRAYNKRLIDLKEDPLNVNEMVTTAMTNPAAFAAQVDGEAPATEG